jgi:hypothetical protein
MRMGNCMRDGNRHQRFTGSALADDDGRSRPLQMFGNIGDSQGLSWKRLPQERFKCWRERIVWPLQRGIHLDNTCPEFLRESSKICVGVSYVVTVHETPLSSDFRLADGHIKKRESGCAIPPAVSLLLG